MQDFADSSCCVSIVRFLEMINRKTTVVVFGPNMPVPWHIRDVIRNGRYLCGAEFSAVIHATPETVRKMELTDFPESARKAVFNRAWWHRRNVLHQGLMACGIKANLTGKSWPEIADACMVAEAQLYEDMQRQYEEAVKKRLDKSFFIFANGFGQLATDPGKIEITASISVDWSGPTQGVPLPGSPDAMNVKIFKKTIPLPNNEEKVQDAILGMFKTLFPISFAGNDIGSVQI